MSKVEYNQAGYIGCSMSERAAMAYDCGEKPLSKWDKDSIVDELPEHLQMEKVMRFSTAVLRNVFLRYSSWHHVGKYANAVSFYSIDENLFEKSEKDILDILNEVNEEFKKDCKSEKEEKELSTLRKCKFCYEVAEGTRRHFKYVDYYAYGILVDGWIYYFARYGVRKKKLSSDYVYLIEEYNRAPKGTGAEFRKILKSMPENKKNLKFN